MEKRYVTEFEKTTTTQISKTHEATVHHPGFRCDLDMTRLCPYGYYNMIAMSDFMYIVGDRIPSLAFDVSDDFFRDLLKDYLEVNNWQFTACREVILYNGMYTIVAPQQASNPASCVT